MLNTFWRVLFGKNVGGYGQIEELPYQWLQMALLDNLYTIQYILQYSGEILQLEDQNISQKCVFINSISFSNESWGRQIHILEKSVTVLRAS